MESSYVMATNNFILVTTDNEFLDGKRARSLEIVLFRIRHQIWPLYEKTRYRSIMQPGDNLFFYCSGKKNDVPRIVGSSRIEAIGAQKKRNELSERSIFLTETPVSVITLVDCKIWDQPIDFRILLPKLECCPKNMTKWGVVLHGGVRRISESDALVILSAIKK